MFQVRVVARDQGSPPQEAVAVVYVTVRRNFNKPRFDPNSYSPRILETQELGVAFATVRATDSDSQVRFKYGPHSRHYLWYTPLKT